MKFKLNIPRYLQKLLLILKDASGVPRLVGGSVRDAILNLPIADVDIATVLLPQDVMNLCQKNNLSVYDTGSKYGTVTAYIDGNKIEITTLRIDTNCNGRHTDPIFTTDFEKDAKRRDFTINAMSYCPFQEELFDYCNGYNDLISKKLIFIGDPEQRIKEDYLRILRFFRFSDKFAQELDDKSFNACVKHKYLLTKLSKERIFSELRKIILSNTCHIIFEIMIKNQVLQEIIPLSLSTELLCEINVKIPNDLIAEPYTKFAALMIRNSVALIWATLKQLHFPRAYASAMRDLISFAKVNSNVANLEALELKDMFYPLWVSGKNMMQYLIITTAWQSKYFDHLQITLNSPPQCPINGNDVLQLGFVGPAIQEELNKRKLDWIRKNIY
jgi:poly(A) polymerase